MSAFLGEAIMRHSFFIKIFLFFLSLYFSTFLLPTYAQEAQNSQHCSPKERKNRSHTKTKSTKTPKIMVEYISHATFKITSPKGVVIETDFTGKFSNTYSPDIITMNQSHTSHYTNILPNDIKSVLKGWSKTKSKPAQHSLKLDDVLIYNIPTDTYQNSALKERHTNSIFIFKIAELCIGHLGQLQHVLSNEQIEKIGALDIVMVPIDGRDVFSTQALIELLKKLHTRIVIPMHWGNPLSQLNFMNDLAEDFQLSAYPVKSLNLSLNTLPKSPTVVTMTPRYANDR